MIGSVVGVLLDNSENFVVIKGAIANIDLDLPYSKSVFLGTVGTASN